MIYGKIGVMENNSIPSACRRIGTLDDGSLVVLDPCGVRFTVWRNAEKSHYLFARDATTVDVQSAMANYEAGVQRVTDSRAKLIAALQAEMVG